MMNIPLEGYTVFSENTIISPTRSPSVNYFVCVQLAHVKFLCIGMVDCISALIEARRHGFYKQVQIQT